MKSLKQTILKGSYKKKIRFSLTQEYLVTIHNLIISFVLLNFFVRLVFPRYLRSISKTPVHLCQ